MRTVQFNLYKGFGISVVMHLLFFAGFGLYAIKAIQPTPTVSTVKVTFISLPEEPQIQAPVPEEKIPLEQVKSVVVEKKKTLPKKPKRKKVEKKVVAKKVKAPQPIQESKPVSPPKNIVASPPVVAKKAVSLPPAVSQADKYISINIAGITTLIQKNLIYPRIARKMGWTGKVIVTFLITKAGEARDIEITASSGRSLLDRAVIDALQRTSRFPLPQTPLSITVPISFSLI